MKRAGLLAAVALIFVFCLGAAIYVRVFAAHESAAGPNPPAVEIPRDAAPPDAPSSGVTVVVGSVRGRVYRKQTDTQWQLIAMGQKLDLLDTIRTDEASRAEFRVGEKGTMIEVPANTQLSFVALTDEVSSLLLKDGRIHASVTGGTESRMRVAFSNSDAVAETDHGEFFARNAEGEQVSVAVQTGSVKLSAKGKEIVVHKGHQSTVEAGHVPSAPIKIPATVFLKIAHRQRALARREAKLKGLSTPGAIVSINGVRVIAGTDGEFETRVQLEEGQNDVEILAEDVLGRTTSESVAVTVDTRAPEAKGELEW